MEKWNNFHEQTSEKSYEQILSEIENALKEGQEKEYIAKRLKELTETSEVRNLGILYARMHKGFIRPESKIQRSPMVDPFHLDDSEIYETLFESIKEFQSSEGWKDKDLRTMMPELIQYTISKYFGNSVGTGTTDSSNQHFYLEHSDVNSEDLSIKELQGKGIAICAEKASVAENLTAFVGLESYIVLSECKLGEKEEFHAFNILKTNNGYFIYDPTNPRIVSEKETGHLKNTSAAIYKISEEDFSKLQNGGGVTVQHVDLTINETGKSEPNPSDRIYVGPKNN